LSGLIELKKAAASSLVSLSSHPARRPLAGSPPVVSFLGGIAALEEQSFGIDLVVLRSVDNEAVAAAVEKKKKLR
jgi:hypothetical protein